MGRWNRARSRKRSRPPLLVASLHPLPPLVDMHSLLLLLLLSTFHVSTAFDCHYEINAVLEREKFVRSDSAIVCGGSEGADRVRADLDKLPLSSLISLSLHNLWTLADYTGPTTPFPPSEEEGGGVEVEAGQVCATQASPCASLCAEACRSAVARDVLASRFPLAERRSYGVWTNDVLGRRSGRGCDGTVDVGSPLVAAPPSPAHCRTRAPAPPDSTFVPVTRKCTDREKRARDLLRELAETTLREWGVDRWLLHDCLDTLPVPSLSATLPGLMWLRVSLPQVPQ